MASLLGRTVCLSGGEWLGSARAVVPGHGLFAQFSLINARLRQFHLFSSTSILRRLLLGSVFLFLPQAILVSSCVLSSDSDSPAIYRRVSTQTFSLPFVCWRFDVILNSTQPVCGGYSDSDSKSNHALFFSTGKLPRMLPPTFTFTFAANSSQHSLTWNTLSAVRTRLLRSPPTPTLLCARSNARQHTTTYIAILFHCDKLGASPFAISFHDIGRPGAPLSIGPAPATEQRNITLTIYFGVLSPLDLENNASRNLVAFLDAFFVLQSSRRYWSVRLTLGGLFQSKADKPQATLLSAACCSPLPVTSAPLSVYTMVWIGSVFLQ
ncbi:hypothetical protein B0T24DRAFT_54383 [Lasiosphaeria ovina]|uniref:Uncharacterized protein n=1 Tax=Lasiosphaeria ovina TaxID=92902 RepID=A0AAE0NLA0_9PEZI|nr:hypothetical protein B0T24DRAFT_54383 [Lasiosphaeria ovina]